MKMNLGWWAWCLLVVGGLNWGLIAVADYNFVAELLGAGSTGEEIIYVLVGLSAVYSAITHARRS